MTALTAKFGGRCGACEDRIVPGQDVVYVDDVRVHVECEDTAILSVRRGRRRAPICPVCFIEKPCGCDDGQGPVAA